VSTGHKNASDAWNYANAAKAKRKGKHRLAQRVRKLEAVGVAYKWKER